MINFRIADPSGNNSRERRLSGLVFLNTEVPTLSVRRSTGKKAPDPTVLT